MKKILVACSLMMLFAIGAYAQPGQGGDTTGRAQRMKENRERQKAGLIDQAKLTSDEADKVLDLQMNRMNGMRNMRDLSDDDRKKRMDSMEAEMDKNLKAIPLTDEKIKAVKTYMASQMRGRGGPGGGNRTAPAPAQQ